MSRVSVIIPAYNRAPMLRQAIRGVLAQTCCDVRVVTADGGARGQAREAVATR